jgi:23S rRNA (uracil1939-C5)-methyltransferase
VPEKKDKPPFTEGSITGLEITDLNHRGEGVGKAESFTLFVPGALPGEQAEVRITAVHKSHAEAELLSLKKRSPHREEPPCPYFYRCGGCQLQHLSYSAQLAWKQTMIAETLRRISGIEVPVQPVLGMKDPWRYRNKALIHLGMDNNKVIAGFYEKGSHRIIDIEDCLVQHRLNSAMITTIRRALQLRINDRAERKAQELPVSGAQIRSSFFDQEALVTLIDKAGNTRRPDLLKVAETINEYSLKPVAGIVMQSSGKKGVRCETLTGKAYIKEYIAPFHYRISPRSFFQVNPEQAGILYETATALAENPTTAFDIYCGTGNFSLYLSRTAGEVIGIDSEKSAIEDARENAALNRINNVTFINARIEEEPGLMMKGRGSKTVFLNPPRRGCSPKLLEAISEAKPDRIVYISCNPSTLARDLALLVKGSYRVKEVQPVDMFPHTSHVETVVLMSRVE